MLTKHYVCKTVFVVMWLFNICDNKSCISFSKYKEIIKERYWKDLKFKPFIPDFGFLKRNAHFSSQILKMWYFESKVSNKLNISNKYTAVTCYSNKLLKMVLLESLASGINTSILLPYSWTYTRCPISHMAYKKGINVLKRYNLKVLIIIGISFSNKPKLNGILLTTNCSLWMQQCKLPLENNFFYLNGNALPSFHTTAFDQFFQCYLFPISWVFSNKIENCQVLLPYGHSICTQKLIHILHIIGFIQLQVEISVNVHIWQ